MGKICDLVKVASINTSEASEKKLNWKRTAKIGGAIGGAGLIGGAAYLLVKHFFGEEDGEEVIDTMLSDIITEETELELPNEEVIEEPGEITTDDVIEE